MRLDVQLAELVGPAVDPAAARLFLVMFGMCTTWGVHDFLQEAVFRRPGFSYGVFMAFCLQATATVGAEIASRRRQCMRVRESTEVDVEQPRADAATCAVAVASDEGGAKVRSSSVLPPSAASDGASDVCSPFSSRSSHSACAAPPAGDTWWMACNFKLMSMYVFLALTLAASNSMSTAALNFVNVPAKVLFKSSKLVPVMIISAFIGAEAHLPLDYACAVAICVGLAVFSYADVTAKAQFSSIGVLLLCGAVFADAIGPNVQTQLLKKMGQSREQVIAYANRISSVLTLLYLVAAEELVPSLAFVSEDRTAAVLLFAQSVAGYLGIMVYMYTLDVYGPACTVIITSTRKMLTIGVSYLFYQKPVRPFHLLGITVVMGAVTLQGYCKQRSSSSSPVAAAAKAQP